MNNQVFSPKRFFAYYRYDLTQLWRNHMKAILGIGLAGLIAYVLFVSFGLIFGNGWKGPGLPARFVVFMLAFTALELYQTRTYGYLTDKKRGSAYLMVPASTTEKWLSMMLNTLVVLPLVFFVVSFLVDACLAAADPTVGTSMFASLGNGLKGLGASLGELNDEYATTWSAGAFVPLFFIGLFVNFLFFLLCGLVFKRNKILWAFAIGFLFSSLISVFGVFFDISIDAGDDFAFAEQQIRHSLNIIALLAAFFAAVLAGGVFLRLKTIKH